MGIPYKLNILFHGYPGTGKTSLIEAIASEFNYQLYMLNFNLKIDDITFIKGLKDIDYKSILVLEDIDCLFEERKQNDGRKHMITFSGLLNTLDGISSKNGLVTILTTNYVTKLDKALLRPGRIDYSLEFTYASKSQIKSMFNKFFENKIESEFNEFWKKIKQCKLTMSMLQGYFLQCYYEKKNIMLGIDKFVKNTYNNKYDENFKTKMYS